MRYFRVVTWVTRDGKKTKKRANSRGVCALRVLMVEIGGLFHHTTTILNVNVAGTGLEDAATAEIEEGALLGVEALRSEDAGEFVHTLQFFEVALGEHEVGDAENALTGHVHDHTDGHFRLLVEGEVEGVRASVGLVSP